MEYVPLFMLGVIITILGIVIHSELTHRKKQNKDEQGEREWVWQIRRYWKYLNINTLRNRRKNKKRNTSEYQRSCYLYELFFGYREYSKITIVEDNTNYVSINTYRSKYKKKNKKWRIYMNF